MKAMGWRPVDAARGLSLSKGSISKILAGLQTPTHRTLELFRSRLRERESAKPHQDSPAMKLTDEQAAENIPGEEILQIMDDIRAVAKTDPEAARQLAAIAKAFRRAGPASSKTDEARKQILKKRAVEVLAETRSSSPEPSKPGHLSPALPQEGGIRARQAAKTK